MVIRRAALPWATWQAAPAGVGIDPSASLLMLMVDGCTSALVVVNSTGLVVRANPAFSSLASRPVEDLVGRPVWEMLPAEDDAQAGTELWINALEGRPSAGETHANQAEQIIMEPNGDRRRLRWSFSRVPDRSGGCRYLIATGNDITRERYSEAVAGQRADLDELTGLANRAEFQTALSQHHHTHSGGAVLLAKLDDFAAVAQAEGQDAGDEILREVANRLRRCVGSRDLVCRFSDDQFALLLPEAGDLEMQAVSSRIEAAVSRPIRLLCGRRSVTITVGCALIGQAEHAVEVVRSADGALHRPITRRFAARLSS